MKKIVSILLTLLLCAALAVPAFAAGLAGEGTKSSPFLIRGEDGWKAFVSYVNNDSNYGEGKYFRLADSIGSRGGEVTDSVKEFHGDFDGNGKTVYYSVDGNSLFQKNYGVIHDLTVDGDTVDCPNAAVGGICSSNYGTIDRCVNRADIKGYMRIAGICSENCGLIVSCINYGSVSPAETGGFSQYAGICASLENGGRLINCFNAGTVTGPFDVAGICAGESCDSEYIPLWLCYNCGLPTATAEGCHNALVACKGSRNSIVGRDCFYLGLINGIVCEASNNNNYRFDGNSKSDGKVIDLTNNNNRIAEAAKELGLTLSYWEMGANGLPQLSRRTTAASTASVLSEGSVWIVCVLGAAAVIAVGTVVIVKKKKKE